MSFILRFQIPHDALEATLAAFTPHFPNHSYFRNPHQSEPFWQFHAFCDKKPDAGLIESLFFLTAFKQNHADDSSNGSLIYHIDSLPQTDWLAENIKAMQPIPLERFVIIPAVNRDCHSPVLMQTKIPIKISGSLAFGTGSHATTQLCLKQLLRLAQKHAPMRGRSFSPIKNILDLGTGTGILAIAAGKLFKNAHIEAIDIAPESIAIAKNNIRINGLGMEKFHVAIGNRPRSSSQKRFDLVIANILARPLMNLQNQIAKATKKSGLLLLSGLTIEQIPALESSYRKNFTLLAKHKQGDWAALLYQRY